jgi:hypothetical protein
MVGRSTFTRLHDSVPQKAVCHLHTRRRDNLKCHCRSVRQNYSTNFDKVLYCGYTLNFSGSLLLVNIGPEYEQLQVKIRSIHNFFLKKFCDTKTGRHQQHKNILQLLYETCFDMTRGKVNAVTYWLINSINKGSMESV